MNILVGVGILAGVFASIAVVCLAVWFLATNLPAFLVLGAAFTVAIGWIIGASTLHQSMPPSGVMWFAFSSAALLIWAIIEPPGAIGRLWKTNGSTQNSTHNRA